MATWYRKQFRYFTYLYRDIQSGCQFVTFWKIQKSRRKPATLHSKFFHALCGIHNPQNLTKQITVICSLLMIIKFILKDRHVAYFFFGSFPWVMGKFDPSEMFIWVIATQLHKKLRYWTYPYRDLPGKSRFLTSWKTQKSRWNPGTLISKIYRVLSGIHNPQFLSNRIIITWSLCFIKKVTLNNSHVAILIYLFFWIDSLFYWEIWSE